MKLFDFGLIIFLGFTLYVATVIHDRQKEDKAFKEKMLKLQQIKVYGQE